MSKLVAALKRNTFGAVLVDVFDWYPSHLPKPERKLLRKLDLTILIYACLSFFCKFLDQSNLTNAYVSGMREDIKAYGNDLNYFNIAFYCGYVIGQIPLMALMTRPRVAPYLLPVLEIVWAGLTFCESRVQTPRDLYVIRALIGFFEAPSFAGVHFILGSWYRKEELFKRAGVWFMGNSLGSMFSGYLQAAAYKNLNHVHGLAGWRWLFIIDGIITFPIAFIGFAFFPGLPNSPKRWFMTDDEYELSRTRMPPHHGYDNGINWKNIKYTLSRPMWYLCVTVYVCMIQGSYFLGYMVLWLKSIGLSVEKVNILPTYMQLVQALSSWLGTTFAATVGLPYMWSFGNLFVFICAIILTVWHVPIGLKYFAWYSSGTSSMTSPILYSWINSALAESPSERALIISSMMTMGYSTFIWVPLLTFPTVEAPRFKKGYPATVGFLFGMWSIGLFSMWYVPRYLARDSARRKADAADEAQAEEELGEIDVESKDGASDEEKK
ncbi:Pantothenate transporter liz1 [Vanrija pseudolonga]|uniref:Pantothenate transporter liz1 n=1 Tax=Vanrija pseudolonga TaxID=143232 RepID=A0AAF0YEF9_9TREE|nr:Pantothenate transporter liz1 [Vanrija pseudolonga]